MKKIITLAAFVLLNCAMFSCTTDDVDTKTDAVKKDSDLVLQEITNPGPGDDPIIVPPPPIKKP